MYPLTLKVIDTLSREATVKIDFAPFWKEVSKKKDFHGVMLMYTLEGVSSVANFINAYDESQ